MNQSYNTALTIAGSDCSGGAGIQADLKTFSALGCYGMSVITAITAQNTQGVTSVSSISPKLIREQLQAIHDDITIDAIKIGMLADVETINLIIDFLTTNPDLVVVLDPVMIAASGDPLITVQAMDELKKLLPLATLITPNLAEAQQLLGITIQSIDEFSAAAIALADQYQTSIYLKGGHLSADHQARDIFLNINNSQHRWLTAPRIITDNTHGTGCTLSSAICANLAVNSDVDVAVTHAKQYITEAIRLGSQKKIGHGHGPVHHFHSFW